MVESRIKVLEGRFHAGLLKNVVLPSEICNRQAISSEKGMNNLSLENYDSQNFNLENESE
ncbi:7186_t:CDS:2 [Cetraspora pellucida]|uniref:7186_t:CDS:1 n=1 Tax=Cetraspora pellucida TaxID=1433469 RepID=A0ACA9LPF8_9GLOM|nr:7186_t:CDS:2 [Cetraspora pellucida]